MKKHMIVAKLKDGSIRKGITDDFAPHRAVFNMETEEGIKEGVDVESLKALFFVKDIEGNKNRDDKYKSIPEWSGKKLKVQFNDRETIIGYALEYSPEKSGFFITPADLQGNNERIYVVTSAIKRVTFL